MHSNYGIAGQRAPELRVSEWLNGPTIRLADIDAPFVYLYFFQSWCPGCHSHGFPTLKQVRDHLDATGNSDLVAFVPVQTVFEGHDTNTAKAGADSLMRHGLGELPLGHDSGHPPASMVDYRTGGTPWTVLVGPDRTVLADGFQFDAEAVIALLDEFAASKPVQAPTADEATNERKP